MISNEIIKILTKLIAKKMEVDISDVVPEADFKNDLGAESLSMVELIMSTEEEFDNDIEFSDEEIGKIPTVQDFFDLVEKKIS